MTVFDFAEHSHRRFNPLTEDWVLVSPQRTQRPWQGQLEPPGEEARPAHDPECYLCPGNRRAGGAVNPDYEGCFVFTNDFAALQPEVPAGPPSGSELLRAEPESGICRVVCFSPRHDLTLAEMSQPEIRRVVDVWADEYASLGALESVRHVQIFENKGAAMGCSNPHPHGQIWAQQSIPSEPARVLAAMQRYFDQHGQPLLHDYLTLELAAGARVVIENEHFVALVPFWGTWPFETMLLARRSVSSIAEMTDAERDGLADMLRRLTIRYDNLFSCSFPYSAGMHQAPTDGGDHSYCSWHMHFYPPLLRSASVRKFMVGYELLAEPQRDITPEASAEMLRAQPETHYKRRSA